MSDMAQETLPDLLIRLALLQAFPDEVGEGGGVLPDLLDQSAGVPANSAVGIEEEPGLQPGQPGYRLQIELQIERGHGCGQREIGHVSGDDAEGFAAEQPLGQAVQDGQVVGGVSRSEEKGQISLAETDNLAVAGDMDLAGGDGKDGAEGLLEVRAEDQTGALDEPGRLSQVRRPARMEDDPGLRQPLGQQARSSAVVDVDMGGNDVDRAVKVEAEVCGSAEQP